MTAKTEEISIALFDRLVDRIVADEHVDRPDAEQIMTECLEFLRLCAADLGTPMSPTPRADIGWHTFILHTKEYAAFCDRIAGRFIHHVPTPYEDTDCSQCHQGCHDSP